MANSKKYNVKCDFLNTEYGEGYWICKLHLTPVNPDMCKYCQERSNRKIK